MTEKEAAVIAIQDGVWILERGGNSADRVHWEGGAFRNLAGGQAWVFPGQWEVYHDPEPEPTPEPEYEEWEVKQPGVCLGCYDRVTSMFWTLTEMVSRACYAGLVYVLPDGKKAATGTHPIYCSSDGKSWRHEMQDGYTDEIHPSAVRVRKGGE